MNIYVASSWKNTLQPGIVSALLGYGHEVYDFRHPCPGNNGFSWAEIDPDWEKWDAEAYRSALKHPIAMRGYDYHISALKRCDACVLVLPSGRSASWEFGYAMGQGKKGVVVQFGPMAPELMYREAEIVTSFDELAQAFAYAASTDNSEKDCRACGFCYLTDEMDFICGHEDADKPFGQLVRIAYAPGGHCGPKKPKFQQHPLRKTNGDLTMDVQTQKGPAKKSRRTAG